MKTKPNTKSRTTSPDAMKEFVGLDDLLEALPFTITKVGLSLRMTRGTFPKAIRLDGRKSPPMWRKEELYDWAMDRWHLPAPEIAAEFARAIKFKPKK